MVMTKHLRFIRSQIRIFCRNRYKKIAAVGQSERPSEPKNILSKRRQEIENLGQNGTLHTAICRIAHEPVCGHFVGVDDEG
jgi:hypothetical protein